MPTFSKFITGQRNSQQLVDSDGYLYVRKKPKDTPLYSAYRCQKYGPPLKCPCHCYLAITDNSLSLGGKPHNHAADTTIPERREAVTTLKRKAADQPLSATQNLLTEVLATTTPEANIRLPGSLIIY